MSAHPAPTDLCYALQQGRLCYIFNIAPTEQALLCSRTRDEMKARGYRSCVIRFSALSSSQYAQVAWDQYLIQALWYTFYPANSVRLSQWFKATESLSARERLIQFTSDLLLSELCEAPITILIDTIDPLVDLPAAVSDLFAWIDYCYDLRDTYLSYHHLSFAVFGQVDLLGLDSFNFDPSKLTQIQAVVQSGTQADNYSESGCYDSLYAIASLASSAVCTKLTSRAQLHEQSYMIGYPHKAAIRHRIMPTS